MQSFFILLLVLIAYTFIGYPVLIHILSKFLSKHNLKNDTDKIPISLVIAAYNEEQVIDEKIKNSLELDYPKERLEIIIVSDGSTDRTEEIVKRYYSDYVKLVRIEGRRGKTYAQNQAVRGANGQIIIFSDANSLYEKDSLKKIVRNYSDKTVGGVCGRLIYLKDKDISKVEEESMYWNYENLIKEKESLLGSVVGANGSIYSVRKDLFVFLDPLMISDFVEPLKIVENGHRFIYEKEALSMESITTVSGDSVTAFKRKVRINIRTILGICACLRMLNIFRYGIFSLKYFSHKILRYSMPFIFIIVFFTNLFILNYSLFTQIIFAFQLGIIFSGILGFGLEKLFGKSWFLSIPFYFLWTHAAILIAAFMVMKGKKTVVWETNR